MSGFVPGLWKAPRRWQSLDISKQGDEDSACGLHGIVNAARLLRSAAGDVNSRQILNRTGPHARRIRERISTTGLFERDIRSLAKAAGLAVYRPNTHDVSQFRRHESGAIWMALVLVKFTASTETKIDERHYVLVVGHLADKGMLVIVDPHPSNPPVYCVPIGDFESAWRTAKTKGPPWAAVLYLRG